MTKLRGRIFMPLCLAVCLVLIALTGAYSPAKAATNTKIPTATRFQLSATTLQAIVVKNTAWTSTYATVEI